MSVTSSFCHPLIYNVYNGVEFYEPLFMLPTQKIVLPKKILKAREHPQLSNPDPNEHLPSTIKSLPHYHNSVSSFIGKPLFLPLSSVAIGCHAEKLKKKILTFLPLFNLLHLTHFGNWPFKYSPFGGENILNMNIFPL